MPPEPRQCSADLLADAALLVRAAARADDAEDGIKQSAAGLVAQLKDAECSQRRVVAWLAEQREATHA